MLVANMPWNCEQTQFTEHDSSVNLEHLTSAARDGATRHVILVLSGALCPVHVGHTAMLREAALRIEQVQPNACVIAGALAPSSDAYVQSKLKKEALPLHTRTALCHLAVAEDPWFLVVPWGDASGPRVCEKLCDAARRQGVTTTLPGFDVLPVYGSDFMVRAPRVLTLPAVIIARADEEDSAAAARRIYDAATAAKEAHPAFTLVEVSSLPEVSSTRVRRLLRDGSSSAADLVHPAVFKRLRETLAP